MRKFFLLTSALFISQSLQAVTSVEEFNKKWAHSQVIKSQNGHSINETKMFKRYIWGGKTPIAVSEGLVTIVKNAEGKTNLKELSEQIDKAFGKKMKIKGNTDKLELHGPFEKLNRTIDVTLQKKGHDFMIVTTFTRTGFYSGLKNDVQELHQISQKYFTHSGNNKTVVKIWQSFSEFVLSSAHAQGINLSSIFSSMNSQTGPQASSVLPSSLPSSGTGSSNPFNGNITVTLDAGPLNTTISNQGDQLSRTIEQEGRRVSDTLTTQGDQLSGTIETQGNQLTNTLQQQGDQLSATLDRQGNQLADVITQQGDQLNQNAKGLTDIIEAQGGALNGNLVSINAQAEVANDNWAQSNKLIAKAMDPNHMAKIAFYSAAGAALGAFTMNLAIQGVTKGLGFLLELFTHEKQKRIEWEDFQKAMETWDTQLNDLVQMEKVVDNFLGAFKFFQNKNLGSNYPELLRQAIRGMSMDRELFLEKFRDQSQELSCRETYFNAAAELEEKIAEYKNLLNLAQGSSMVTDNPEAYFCGQLSELRRKILSAEQSLQNLRLQILLAERQFYDRQKEIQDRQQLSAQRIDNRIDTSTREREQRREQIARDTNRRLEQQRRDWIRSCTRGENADGQRIKQDRSLSRSQVRQACVSAYIPPAGIAVPTSAPDEEILRADLSILGNDYVDVNLNQQQQQWFTKIHMDAYCFQYAHRPATEMPQKCTEFPETLYSIGLTNAYNKADAAYQSSCAQRYQDGIRELAQSSH